MAEKIAPFLLFGFLAHNAGLAGGYFAVAHGGRFSPEDGHNSFELAVVFGPLISLLFVLILLATSLFRIKQVYTASLPRRLGGAALAACLALVFEFAMDWKLASIIDAFVMPPWLGDWLAPVFVFGLVLAACYAGVRFAIGSR